MLKQGPDCKATVSRVIIVCPSSLVKVQTQTEILVRVILVRVVLVRAELVRAVLVRAVLVRVVLVRAVLGLDCSTF